MFIEGLHNLNNIGIYEYEVYGDDARDLIFGFFKTPFNMELLVFS